MITTIVGTAKMMNVNRIVIGGGITHPFGHPGMSSKEEKDFRRVLVERALKALKTKVQKPTIFS